MNAHVKFSRRRFVKGGALTVALAVTGLPKRGFAQAARTLDRNELDAFFRVNGDGSVTLYCGKVDLGQGLRIAMPQIAAEELGIGIDKIKYVEGDTALTPDQGRTSGSNGIQVGGMQIRQAAATARKGLIDLGAQKLNAKAEDLITAEGMVRPKAGGRGISFAELIAGKNFNLKLDPKAPLKNPAEYTVVGKPLPRPDVPAKCTGRYTYIQDFSVPNMLHGRIVRPPAVGASLVSVDESSVASLPGVKVVRVKDFLAVTAQDEWTAIKAVRALKAQWSGGTALPEQGSLMDVLRNEPGATAQTLVNKGTPGAELPADAKSVKATYFWPMQSHASMGPSAAVADVTSERATIWTASQGTHGNQTTMARVLKLPKDKVRLIYIEGSGCYGMNGHEDAAADAAILSQAVGRPVRVQWSREDEHGWDPKGPPQLIDVSGAVSADGRILDWKTEMWIPETTRGMPNIPLLAPEAAGLDNVRGNNAGLISQNGDPPYASGGIQVIAHWLKGPPLRAAPIRSPGKPANCFAVESFTDELAVAAGVDPLEFRLRGLTDPRGTEVMRRAAAMMKWQPRTSPGSDGNAAVARGRGLAYIHYKFNEAYVGMGMEVAVERSSGKIKVVRVVCAHDCGQIINPDTLRSQLEGAIIQTLSRALLEEVKFDRNIVTSVDWSSYPILTFSDVPNIEIELINRPNEKPVGAAEAACCPVGPALANAVFDATGARMRILPLTPERVKAALQGRV
jgi:nicotinate dehydrogenase subunit B